MLAFFVCEMMNRCEFVKPREAMAAEGWYNKVSFIEALSMNGTSIRSTVYE